MTSRIRILSILLAAPFLASAVHAANLTLHWNAPASNKDGSPLTDLAGYVVYYGRSPGQYEAGVDVGSDTRTTLTDLQAGATYHVAVKAYNKWGYAGDYSQPVTVTLPLSPLPDADADGLPDAWEIEHFGTLSSEKGDPDGDYDGDGYANLQEYTAGTDPADSASGPFILLSVQNKHVTLSFEALKAGPGQSRYYALERSESLSQPDWAPIPGFDRILGDDSVITYTERNRKRAFYRLSIWLE